MKLSEAHPGMRVRYAATRVYDGAVFPSEGGYVSSVNEHYVFVKFDKDITMRKMQYGNMVTATEHAIVETTAKACRAEDLDMEVTRESTYLPGS